MRHKPIVLWGRKSFNLDLSDLSAIFALLQSRGG
jgi:hypothetical protein